MVLLLRVVSYWGRLCPILFRAGLLRAPLIAVWLESLPPGYRFLCPIPLPVLKALAIGFQRGLK